MDTSNRRREQLFRDRPQRATELTPNWVAAAERKLPVLTAVWVAVWVVVAILKVWAWWPASGGLVALFKSYSLSAAGDFLAGVAAIPAFAWVVIAYFVQRSELNATVQQLASQSDSMRRQLELMKAEQDNAVDPLLQVTCENIKELNAIGKQRRWKHSVSVAVGVHTISDVIIHFRGLVDKIEKPRAVVHADELGDGEMRRLFPIATTPTLWGVELIVDYVRRNASIGQQVFQMNREGTFVRTYDIGHAQDDEAGE